MKKLSLLLVMALLATTLAACNSATPAQTNVPPETTKQADSTPPADNLPADNTPAANDVSNSNTAQDYISREEAVKIALDHAKLEQSQVQDLEIDLDKDDNVVHYDVGFEKDGKDYDYEIDAQTGKILRSETPIVKAENTANQKTEDKLTANEARDIALKHANLKASDVRDLEVELDKDGGKLHYDVDFEKDNYDYEYEIDAYTGKILKSKKEKD